jgi:hypothetical protein
VSLGVVPFGVEHPQVPRLGEALARSGFAALLYWSPAMRDLRLDPADIASIAGTYQRLIERPDIDVSRSGLLGTCVGGAFALMAAADSRIRERVAFVAAFAPYASMRSFALDIASATREGDRGRQPWAVDQLTRRVFVRSLTEGLPASEAEALEAAFVQGTSASRRSISRPQGARSATSSRPRRSRRPRERWTGYRRLRRSGSPRSRRSRISAACAHN